MYVVYEEHIEQLEEENEELKTELKVLKQKLQYYIRVDKKHEWEKSSNS